MRISVKDVIWITGIAIAVFLGMKYILPIVIPFLFAWFLVRLILPAALLLENRLHIKKGLAGGILLILLLAILGIALYLLGSQLLVQIRNLADNADIYLNKAEEFVEGCCRMVEKSTGIQGRSVENFVYANLDRLEERIQVSSVPGMLKNSLAYLMGAVKWLGMVLVIFVSFMLILKDYDELREALKKYGVYEKIHSIMTVMQSLGGAWFRAQILIILAVIVVCVTGLWLLGYEYALLMGILIGLLDALPFIGTGTVLIPWGGFLMLTGDFWYGAGLVALFLAANTLREFLEPKLIGDRIGVYPIVMVAAVYIGICVYGVSGVLLGPVSLVLIVEVWREIKRNGWTI